MYDQRVKVANDSLHCFLRDLLGNLSLKGYSGFIFDTGTVTAIRSL